MKILHLCTYDTGGAANAALRLHGGLKQLGEESVFASGTTAATGPDRLAVIKPRGDWVARHSPRIEFHLARLLFPTVRPVLTRGLLPGFGMRAIEVVRPDVLNLHWVEHGMISTRDLARLAAARMPLVWTLHDMTPAAGGFGYRECVGLNPAAFGPLICGNSRAAASREILEKRRQALQYANLTVVTPSGWLAEEARRSPVFQHHRIEHIPYGIDTTTFKPVPASEARARWNLPMGHRIILFGADTFEDERKGIHHLRAALAKLPSEINGKPLLLVGFGNPSALRSSDFPIPVCGMGRLTDLNEIASLYSAADVFVCPSREDNLPNTMVESLSCGTPVVGFGIGGLTDLVIPGQTGHLAPAYDEEMLSQCIAKVLSAVEEETLSMRSSCRESAERQLRLEIQALRYQQLYRDILGGSK